MAAEFDNACFQRHEGDRRFRQSYRNYQDQEI